MQKNPQKTTYLYKRRSLDTRHPPHHCAQELGQDPHNCVAGPPHQVNDKISNEQTPGLVCRLQLPRNKLENMVKSSFACAILPRQDLRRVLPHKQRQRCNRILNPMSSAWPSSNVKEGTCTWIASRSATSLILPNSTGPSCATNPSPTPPSAGAP